MRLDALTAAAMAAAMLSGCASYVERLSAVGVGSETLTLATDPSGATCRVLRGNETLATVTTPGEIAVTTSPDDIIVLCKKPEYEIAAVVLHANTDQTPPAAGTVGGWIGDTLDRPHYLYDPTTRLSLMASREPPNSDYSQAAPTSELKPGDTNPMPPEPAENLGGQVPHRPTPTHPLQP